MIKNINTSIFFLGQMVEMQDRININYVNEDYNLNFNCSFYDM